MEYWLFQLFDVNRKYLRGRGTKYPTAYTRESNQYPCHLSNTPKKNFMQKELKAENQKKKG